jgi:hypothetical protein
MAVQVGILETDLTASFNSQEQLSALVETLTGMLGQVIGWRASGGWRGEQQEVGGGGGRGEGGKEGGGRRRQGSSTARSFSLQQPRVVTGFVSCCEPHRRCHDCPCCRSVCRPLPRQRAQQAAPSLQTWSCHSSSRQGRAAAAGAAAGAAAARRPRPPPPPQPQGSKSKRMRGSRRRRGSRRPWTLLRQLPTPRAAPPTAPSSPSQGSSSTRWRPSR